MGDYYMIERIVPDTSVLIEGILSKKIEHDEILPKEIIIHEASLSELEAQANTGREIGYMGLDEIKKLTFQIKEIHCEICWRKTFRR